MEKSRNVKEKKKNAYRDYERLLEDLMEETRRILLEAKKDQMKNKKMRAKEKLFDEFVYINSLKHTATTTEGYQEAYRILAGSLNEFRNQIS